MGTNSNEIQKDEENYIVRQKKKKQQNSPIFLNTGKQIKNYNLEIKKSDA